MIYKEQSGILSLEHPKCMGEENGAVDRVYTVQEILKRGKRLLLTNLNRKMAQIRGQGWDLFYGWTARVRVWRYI